jgi:Tfp pilus assembly protein PilZ
VFIATYRRVDIGCRVAVSLSLPAGDVQVVGVVDWIRDACDGASPGVGIAFEDLSVEARAGIEAFSRLRAPLYHEAVTRRFRAVAE